MKNYLFLGLCLCVFFLIQPSKAQENQNLFMGVVEVPHQRVWGDPGSQDALLRAHEAMSFMLQSATVKGRFFRPIWRYRVRSVQGRNITEFFYRYTVFSSLKTEMTPYQIESVRMTLTAEGFQDHLGQLTITSPLAFEDRINDGAHAPRLKFSENEVKWIQQLLRGRGLSRGIMSIRFVISGMSGSSDEQDPAFSNLREGPEYFGINSEPVASSDSLIRPLAGISGALIGWEQAYEQQGLSRDCGSHLSSKSSKDGRRSEGVALGF